MKKYKYFIVAFLLILFSVSYFFFRLDDTFIFYKYSQNIAEGNGYVFNEGEKVNATTSPLYTLILAFLYSVVKLVFPVSFIILGNFISTLSIAVILYLMKRILKNEELFFIFALIFLAMPLLKFGFGMETFLNLALIICSIYFFTEEKYNAASFFTALSVLARLDSILFALILFSYYIITKHKFPSLKTLGIFFITLLPWFVFSLIYFNALLPTTINIKLSQNKLELFGSGFIFLTNSVRVIPGRYISVFTIVIAAIASVIFLRKKRINFRNNEGIYLIIVWSIALFIIYAFIIKAMPYQWYYTPFALPLSIIFSLAILHLHTGKLKKIILTVIFIIALILPIKTLIEGYNPKYLNFNHAAYWLNKNAPMGTIVGTDDIGVLGFYYSKGKIVDAHGLITPDVTKHLFKKDYNWFINSYNPAFIVNEYPNIQKYVSGDPETFWENYMVVKVFESRGEKIGIYKSKLIHQIN